MDVRALARMRAWVKRRLARGKKPPSAAEVEAVVSGERPLSSLPKEAPAAAMAAAPLQAALTPARRFSDWLIGAGVLGAQIYRASRRQRT